MRDASLVAQREQGLTVLAQLRQGWVPWEQVVFAPWGHGVSRIEETLASGGRWRQCLESWTFEA